MLPLEAVRHRRRQVLRVLHLAIDDDVRSVLAERETLDEMLAAARRKTRMAVNLSFKVCGIDDERAAFPTADRMSSINSRLR